MAWYDFLLGRDSEEEKVTPKETTYSPYANEQIEALKKYLTPYADRGELVGGDYTNTSRELMTDPTGYYNRVMSDYQESPIYQKKLDDMLKRARSAAASGGMVGTQADQETQMTLSNALLSEDMQKFLDNILGIQKTGMAGSSDIYRTGYDSSRNLGEDIASVYGGKASADIQERKNEQDRVNSLANVLFRGLGTLAGAGIGYGLGGPAGAGTGAYIGSQIGK